MKTSASRVRDGLLLSLLLVGTIVNAQSIEAETEAPPDKQTFTVATYMGTGWTINLMLAVHDARGITLTLKNEQQTILYTRHLKKARKAYHQKLSFDGSQPGVYRLEISDGRQTIVRRINIVDMPAIESQRYMTYSAQTIH